MDKGSTNAGTSDPLVREMLDILLRARAASPEDEPLLGEYANDFAMAIMDPHGEVAKELLERLRSEK